MIVISKINIIVKEIIIKRFGDSFATDVLDTKKDL